MKKHGQHHCNKVSFTEEDFMNSNMIGLFDRTIEEEQIPPADRNIFDHSPEGIRVVWNDKFRSIQDDWTRTQRPLPVPVPVYTQSIPTVFNDDDAIRIPSLDDNSKWSPQNLIITIPIPTIFDEDDAIRIPSLDDNLKWSPQNPIITIPNIGHTALAHAVSSSEASIHGAQLSILEELKRMTYRQTMKPIKPAAQISEEEITDRDVICERGGKSNRHAGTKRYRGMIEKFKPQYQSLTAKTAKTNLSRKIISQIQENGGRFLKKDEKSHQYFVLSPVETTKKVSQAMREKKALKWTEDCTSTKSEKKVSNQTEAAHKVLCTL